MLNLYKTPLPNNGWPPSGIGSPPILGPVLIEAYSVSVPGLPSVHVPDPKTVGNAGTSLVDSLGNTATGAWGKVKGGLDGQVITAKNGIQHQVKNAADPAGWVLNETGIINQIVAGVYPLIYCQRTSGPI